METSSEKASLEKALMVLDSAALVVVSLVAVVDGVVEVVVV